MRMGGHDPNRWLPGPVSPDKGDMSILDDDILGLKTPQRSQTPAARLEAPGSQPEVSGVVPFFGMIPVGGCWCLFTWLGPSPFLLVPFGRWGDWGRDGKLVSIPGLKR